jgi:hypothetical protein
MKKDGIYVTFRIPTKGRYITTLAFANYHTLPNGKKLIDANRNELKKYAEQLCAKCNAYIIKKIGR